MGGGLMRDQGEAVQVKGSHDLRAFAVFRQMLDQG